MGLLSLFFHTGGNLFNRYNQLIKDINRLNAQSIPDLRGIERARRDLERLKHDCTRTLEKKLPPSQVRDINRVIIYCNSQPQVLENLKRKMEIALRKAKQRPVQPRAR